MIERKKERKKERVTCLERKKDVSLPKNNKERNKEREIEKDNDYR